MSKVDSNASHKSQRKKAIEARKKRMFSTVDREFGFNTKLYSHVSANSNRMYSYYKNANIHPKFSYEEWRKIVFAIFKEVRDKLIENDSGVFLKDFGYFGIVVYPEVDDLLCNVVDMKETLHIHKPHFFPIRKDNKLQPWTMIRAFSESLNKEMYSKSDSGKKYKLEYTSLSGMYSTKTSNKWKKD